MTTHLFIPDMQVKPSSPLDAVRWIGQYILDKRPDVIVNVGDWWDMPSLSVYDRGKIQFEGRRYREDIKAGNDALKLLDHAVDQFNYGRRKRGQEEYKPRKVFLMGNHEDRIRRLIEENAILDGTVGFHDLNTRDWEVHGFLEPVWIDGVCYSHFFYNPMTGKPIGGQVSLRLKTIGHSFTMGHQQTLDISVRFVGGKQQIGLVAGAAYLEDEDYKGPQGNAHWRGVIVKHQVSDGSYDPMFVSLDYLCNRYEGMPLYEFLNRTYPDLNGQLWKKP